MQTHSFIAPHFHHLEAHTNISKPATKPLGNYFFLYVGLHVEVRGCKEWVCILYVEIFSPKYSA